MSEVLKRLSGVQTLKDLIADLPRGLTKIERMKFVLTVSEQDTDDVERSLFEGGFGDQLKSDFFVKGLKGTLPTFLGFLVLWNRSKTEMLVVDNLSQSDLISIISTQHQIIETLYEHRQRL